MPTAYGAEFRQDVIDVARKGEAPLSQIAKDFGLSVTTLKRWIAIAERKESGAGPANGDSAEMRELKKRNRLLEPDPLPGILELRSFLLRHTGTGAVLDVGFLEPVVQGCFGNPEVFGDLRDRGFVLPSNGDHVAAELGRERLGHVNILAARNESSQVRSQANPGQSHRSLRSFRATSSQFGTVPLRFKTEQLPDQDVQQSQVRNLV